MFAKPGKHTLKVSYSGATKVRAVTSTFVLTVVSAPTLRVKTVASTLPAAGHPKLKVTVTAKGAAPAGTGHFGATVEVMAAVFLSPNGGTVIYVAWRLSKRNIQLDKTEPVTMYTDGPQTIDVEAAVITHRRDCSA